MKKLFSIIQTIYRIFFKNPITEYRKRGMKIGKNCSIGTWEFYDEAFLIEIGDHVQITAGVKLFTHGGGWVLRKKYPEFDSFGKIIIGNNVYIGNNAIIMPGITIGDNVVIGAGAVVTKNIPCNVIVAGNPARIINTYENYEKKCLKHNINCKSMNLDKKKVIILKNESKLIKCNNSL